MNYNKNIDIFCFSGNTAIRYSANSSIQEVLTARKTKIRNKCNGYFKMHFSLLAAIEMSSFSSFLII